MNVKPTWSMFGWVCLSQFLLGLVMQGRLLFSTYFLVAVLYAIAWGLKASVLVILGVWMYKLDHRNRIPKPAIVTSPNQDIE